MKRCLSPARLLRLDRRPPLRHLPSTALRPPRTGPRLDWSPFEHLQPQWGRQYSVNPQPLIDRSTLQEYIRLKPKKCPVPRSDEKSIDAWISLLEQHIPPSLRRSSEDDNRITDHMPETCSQVTQKSLMQAIDLANLLFYARASANLDLLAHLGFKLNNWPAVYFLLSRLLDGTDALQELSLPLQCGVIGELGSSANLTLDQLTDQCLSSAPRIDAQCPTVPQIPGFTTLDAFTERPFAQDHAKSFMAEVWQSLGSIVLDATDALANESKLAMSYVFRVLARLHHSGAVSDRVYRYIPPDIHQATFRPPGMHLLSTHIMDVLSDTAWLAHEAEVTAKAAAAGEDPPFLPFKMGIRELGSEIWLEFILWCCVEHGHIKEGVWLIEQLRTRAGDLAWKFRSWKPLLEAEQPVSRTRIDKESSWYRPETAEIVDRPSLLRPRSNPTSPFNGLGKRTISVEIATALLDNLPNLVYLGLGFRGVHAAALLRSINSLKFAIDPTAADAAAQLLPTTRASNWFAVRVIESGGLNPEADPQTFDDFLRVSPYVVPPWSNDMCAADENMLTQLPPSQIYDDTAAFAGLIEYNLRFYSARRLCGDALNTFAMLQTVIDTSKMQRIHEFFSSRMEYPHTDRLYSLNALASSGPQVSNVTMAGLLDLVTTSRAFAFGEWLLFSEDIDGPSIPSSAYGDQALAPSIIRFAAATQNTTLCEAVVGSLAQPISANTLRALLNYRIVMHQWDLVVPMLEYLRDYRSKSWGHSNIATLAGEIIRLDHTIAGQEQSDLASVGPLEESKRHLAQAKEVLNRALNGEFNELSHRSGSRFQERALYAFQRVFLTLPSPSLRDIAQSTSLPHKSNTTTRNALPYLPSTAFHRILSAIVDTKGSIAGKHLWDQWCVDIKSPAHRRLQEGGIPRLYLGHERNRNKGDPHFDAIYFKQLQKKLTIPNVNTVRIIAQAAVREYEQRQQQRQQEDEDEETSSMPPPLLSPNPAQEILEFCIKKFDALGLRRREINREVGGLVYRKRREHDKEKKRKNKKEKENKKDK